MEPIKITLSLWPQALVVIVMATITIRSFVKNGQPMPEPNVNAYRIFWTTMWFALVLGMGGFWHG